MGIIHNVCIMQIFDCKHPSYCPRISLQQSSFTPPRTPRISGLKSQVLKPTFLRAWAWTKCFSILFHVLHFANLLVLSKNKVETRFIRYSFFGSMLLSRILCENDLYQCIKFLTVKQGRREQRQEVHCLRTQPFPKMQSHNGVQQI